MKLSLLYPEFQIIRNEEKCIQCEICVRQCGFEVHTYDRDGNRVISDSFKCVGCHRCATLCPTQALVVSPYLQEFRRNYNWRSNVIRDIFKQSEVGGVLLSGMGCDKEYPIYWDKLLLDASQVTNPSIDPLREPMELKAYLGSKPEKLEVERDNKRKFQLKTKMAPQLELETPIMFSAMSYGSISYNVCLALAQAAQTLGIYYNTGEGGLHQDLYQFGKNTIVQVASGRFGVHSDYLDVAAAIEIKIGQGAKPGIGGHLPGEKVTQQISETRM
ncbi:MAG: glutamate synthase-related protein, partial [bacterium]